MDVILVYNLKKRTKCRPCGPKHIQMLDFQNKIRWEVLAICQNLSGPCKCHVKTWNKWHFAKSQSQNWFKPWCKSNLLIFKKRYYKLIWIILSYLHIASCTVFVPSLVATFTSSDPSIPRYLGQVCSLCASFVNSKRLCVFTGRTWMGENCNKLI